MKTNQFATSGGLLLTFLIALPAHATDYYVATTGADTNAGTMAAPFATVGRAQTAAVAGDTVFIRGGTYTFSGTTATFGVRFTKSGLASRYINYFAMPGEIPVFDLFNLTPQARVTGLSVECNWIHIRGLEVRGVQQFQSGQDSWGVRIQGSNNILENLNVHHNQAPGVFITSGANNLILNCDSHHNYDVLEGGGSGDGFGCHSSGGGNVLRACRSYSNSDDGFDFINADGTCTAEMSWSFTNGWIPDTNTAAGNGAGFKSGGYGFPPSNVPNPIPRHVIRLNVAFGNRSQGIYANHHPGPGGIDFFNNTSFGNPVNFDMNGDVGVTTHTLRNNIAMTGTAIRNLNGGTDTFNSWTLAVTVTAADFLSVAQAEALTPRQADGSLPSVSFMHLAAGSDLIDKGTDVGLPFAGAAPDLGAFESGLAPPDGGIGGAGGAGRDASVADATGAAGRGGAPGAGGSTGASGAPGVGGTPGTGGVGSGAVATGGAAGTGAAGASAGSSSSGGGAGSANAAGSGGSGGMDSGCSCRVPARPAHVAGIALLPLAALAALVRRRRSARCPSTAGGGKMGDASRTM